MAYSVRSLADLGTQARQFFTQAIPGAIASVWANTFTILGKVLALLDFEHDQRRAWLFRQMFASTAEEVWLRRHGFELGLTQDPASVAVGTITLAATPGTVVLDGLTFTREDGQTYTTVAPETAGGNAVTLSVEADVAGVAGNTAAGIALTLDASADIEGLAASAVATVDASGLTGGADLELVETFRARVLARKRKPPMGGSTPDYQEWAGEALPTVRDVFVDTFQNDNRAVWVQFTVSDQPNGIPSAGQVDIVQAYLDDPVRRPVTARVFVSASDPVPVDVTIGSLAPNTTSVLASVEAELQAVFIDRAEPGTPSADFLLSKSWLDEAISRATGEDRHVLTTPATDLTFTAGQMPVLGNIVYV